jgi:hypothetical protein
MAKRRGSKSSDDYRDELWQRIPAIEFAEPRQYASLASNFMQFLDDVRSNHVRPQDSIAWQNFMQELGLDDGDFPWETFREWYAAA